MMRADLKIGTRIFWDFAPLQVNPHNIDALDPAQDFINPGDRGNIIDITEESLLIKWDKNKITRHPLAELLQYCRVIQA